MTDRGDFAKILDEYLGALEAGDPPDREALLAEHPDLAEELGAALLGIDLLHGAAPRLAPEEHAGEHPDALPGGMLGDYRLIRELGRGGMAVVYEAEQISLGRHVALKVLPFAAVLDPKQLQRFKNEAMAAAHLHHSNIVPVYGVGCERGVHYYAMQYIEGQSLATAIRGMKGAGRSKGEGPKTPISSHGSNREPAYIRMAAELGVQAAEALDHAHQLGIVHRDVKPGNLLADLAGTLWVTDFGLASSKKDVSLTITGELLGTIRYMSPEQALAKRVPVDHRTDVYSLGATLYELFTLQPAFPGDDPHLLIQDIAFNEPVLPRRLNPALPRDLETVILKAMWKDPSGRYATAQEMADDLKRQLEDKPIVARRPSLAARAAMWSRRHRGLVAASFVVMLLAMAALVVDSIRVGHEEKNTYAALQTAKTNLALAREAVDKFLVEAGIMELADGPLPQPSRVVLLEAALEFYANLEDRDALYTRGKILHALHRYEETLAVFDRLLASQPENSRALAERGHMLWHLKRAAEALVALDRSIEIDPASSNAHVLRGNALGDLGGPTEALADYDRAIVLDPRNGLAHSNRGMALNSLARFEEAVAAHREAIRLQPGDGSRHFNLGTTLSAKGDPDDAIGEFREAIRLQPDHAMAHSNLGVTLLNKGDVGGAIGEFREAIRFDPKYANAHDGLGAALKSKGELDEAIREHREAILLEPDLQQAHINLGNALADKGDFDAAIREYREAIRLEPDDAVAHSDLCLTLVKKGDPEGAIREGREAIRLGPDLAEAHCSLGIALAKCDPDGAIRELHEAMRLKPASAEPHFNLGCVLSRKGDPGGAIREYLEAIRLKPDSDEAHSNLGAEFYGAGDLDGAIREFRESIRLEPDAAQTHYNLGTALNDKGDADGAIASFREAIRIEPDRALTHNNLALALLKKGDLDGEIASYREAIRLDPDFALAHKNLGTALRIKGDLDGAIASFREAIRIEPDNAEAHGKLGAALIDKGDFDGAIAACRKAIQLKPDYAKAHANLGSALLSKGDLDGAIDSDREAIRIEPDLAGAHSQLGAALLTKGDLDAAIAACRKAILLDPDYVEAYSNLGAALFDKGDQDGAIASFREAVRVKPDYAEAYCNLGMALMRQGHFREALLWLRKGHEIGSKRPGWALPSKELIAEAERKAELQGRLDEMLSGKAQPADALERIEFALALYAKARHAESARMYVEAFAEDAALAEDPAQDHRYNAACSAALAAAPGEADAAEWRGRALEWLRADLQARERAAIGLAATLEHWKKDPDFASVRDRLGDLPEPERAAWRGLWADVDLALAAALPAVK